MHDIKTGPRETGNMLSSCHACQENVNLEKNLVKCMRYGEVFNLVFMNAFFNDWLKET